MSSVDILVLFYSKTGGTQALAQAIARGVNRVENASARLRTVPPVSTTCEATESAIAETGAQYATYEELASCDGLALGSPTRFGNMAAPMKYFLDGSAELWLKGALKDKPASVFTASQAMHGGQESTCLSMLLPLLHHGMVFVGLPFTEQRLSKTQTGGTPYGASHVSSLASSKGQLSEDETLLATLMGERLARLALKLKG
jgi:NAD(P)H dehydrogenase (quinone)